MVLKAFDPVWNPVAEVLWTKEWCKQAVIMPNSEFYDPMTKKVLSVDNCLTFIRFCEEPDANGDIVTVIYTCFAWIEKKKGVAITQFRGCDSGNPAGHGHYHEFKSPTALAEVLDRIDLRADPNDTGDY